MFPVLVFVSLVSTALGAVPNPQTPNQVADSFIEALRARIVSAGWGSSKPLANQQTNFNLVVANSGNTYENFRLSSALISGLGSVDRSASAEFLSNQTVLQGTIKFTNLRVTTSYTVTFAGIGAAPANTVSGSVTETASHMFIDYQLVLNSAKVPQSVRSWTARLGHEGITSLSANSNDSLAAINRAAIREALQNILLNALNVNVRAQANLAIADLNK